MASMLQGEASSVFTTVHCVTRHVHRKRRNLPWLYPLCSRDSLIQFCVSQNAGMVLVLTLALDGRLELGELAGDNRLGDAAAEVGIDLGGTPVVAYCTASSSFFFLISSSLSVTLFSTAMLPAFRPNATRTARAASLMSGAASFADLATTGSTVA